MIPLYGKGMHDYVMREIEIGKRATLFEDEEWSSGWTAIDDIIYKQYARREEMAKQQITLIEYLFVHNHECSYKDEEYVYRPAIRNGVAEVATPICVETNAVLEEILVRKS